MLRTTESWCLRQEIRRLTPVRRTYGADRFQEVTIQYGDTLHFTEEMATKLGFVRLEQSLRTEAISGPPSWAEAQHCASAHRFPNPGESRPRAYRREARPQERR